MIVVKGKYSWRISRGKFITRSQQNMAEDPSAAGDVDAAPKKIKVTAVGDSGVGKTCMLMTFANDEFPLDGRIPSLYESGTLKGKQFGVGGVIFTCIL